MSRVILYDSSRSRRWTLPSEPSQPGVADPAELTLAGVAVGSELNNSMEFPNKDAMVRWRTTYRPIRRAPQRF